MKQHGFTLIELMIVIAILAIIAAIIFGMVNGNSANSMASYGVNGYVETRCIDGYKFIVGHDGSARQIMDEQGQGMKCQQ